MARTEDQNPEKPAAPEGPLRTNWGRAEEVGMFETFGLLALLVICAGAALRVASSPLLV